MEIKPVRAKDRQFVVSEESYFAFDELFFSRTDENGKILSGNSVFQRVSGYDWDELLDKPHSLIRHPDMPRAVFWLLWNTIEKGEPIGAYVKNRSKDGRYYWVFAIVTPIEGGYLSVRLKPSSPFLGIVEKEYAELRALENKENLKPQESAEILLERLQELGFGDYASFMSTAVSKEITARDQQMRSKEDEVITYFEHLLTSSQQLLEHATLVSDVYEKNKNVPLNLRVQVSHLGPEGAPMNVISENYTAISSNIKADMGGFIESCRKVEHTVKEGLFLTCISRMQRETINLFKTEDEHEGVLREQEMQSLEDQQHSFTQKASEGLESIAKQVREFELACTQMGNLTTNLEITRVIGRIEGSIIDSPTTNVNELIEQLGTFQEAVKKGLSHIHHTNQEIRFDIDKILLADSNLQRNVA